MTQFLAGCEIYYGDPHLGYMLLDANTAPQNWKKFSNGTARRWYPTGKYIQFSLEDRKKDWAFISEAVYSFNTSEQALKVFQKAMDENYNERFSFTPETVVFSSKADHSFFVCEAGSFNSYPTLTCSILLLFDNIMVDLGTNAINEDWLTITQFRQLGEMAEEEVLKYKE